MARKLKPNGSTNMNSNSTGLRGRWLWASSFLLLGACTDHTAPAEIEQRPSLAMAFQGLGADWRPARDSIGPRQLEFPPENISFGAEVSNLRRRVAATGGRVVIGLKPPSAARTKETGVVPGIARGSWEDGIAALLEAGVRVTRAMRNFPIVTAVIDVDSIESLLQTPSVNYIEPNEPMQSAAVAPSGTLRTSMISTQDSSWGIHKIQAPAAWNLGYDGDGVTVWIIDLGADSVHVNTAGHDWNLTNAYCMSFPGQNTCYDPGNNEGHGVLVHSVAIGPDNDVGWIGVAHGVSGNWMVNAATGNGEAAFFGNVVAGLDTMISREGDPVGLSSKAIVNMSLRTVNNYTAMQTAVAEAWDHGILLVAAAGNNDDPVPGIRYPAKYGDVIAVTGTDEDDGFAEAYSIAACDFRFSNSGTQAELSAPFHWQGIGLDGDMDETIDPPCGTSFAAPAVAGVAALIWDKYPSFTNAQVRLLLKKTAKDVEAAGWDSETGWGRVDAYRAVYCPAEGCKVDFNLDGPEELDVDEGGTWYVSDLVGGVSPYTYAWYKDDVLQSGQTSSSFSTSFPTASANHTIKVVVTPTFGDADSDFLYVDVTGCEEEWCG